MAAVDPWGLDKKAQLEAHRSMRQGKRHLNLTGKLKRRTDLGASCSECGCPLSVRQKKRLCVACLRLAPHTV